MGADLRLLQVCGSSQRATEKAWIIRWKPRVCVCRGVCWLAEGYVGCKLDAHLWIMRAVLAALVAISLIAASVALCYGFADRLARALGKTGMTVIIRLSAFLLLCIGVQIMWNGISALLSSLPLHVP